MLVGPETFIKNASVTTVALDVRSEGEFASGHLPFSINRPILNDNHRHQVGKCYRERGPETAISLGQSLVAPCRGRIVEEWRQIIEARESPPLLFCWRGGLRSQIASEWLRERSIEVRRVAGGYRAIRQLLTDAIRTPKPLLVVGGFTGSGKTALLTSIPAAVDLELCAQHRGSAFGSYPDLAQPPQQTFENLLGLNFYRVGQEWGCVVIEDESRLIGRREVPESLFRRKQQAPIVWLDESTDSRVHRIYEEYIGTNEQCAHLCDHFTRALTSIKKRLGGALHAELMTAIKTAFGSGDYDMHCAWIRNLLVRYYDPRYHHAFARGRKKVRFRGDREAVRQWITAWSDQYRDRVDHPAPNSTTRTCT